MLSELSKAAREFGLQYPIDPSTANRATIGGGIGNNSCGAHSAIYGKTVDNVVDLEVVLADGTLTQLGATSGAELEQVVVDGLYRAFRSKRDLTGDDLGVAIKSTVPLYRTYEDEIKALREWASSRARKASTDARLSDLWRDVSAAS